MRKTTNQPGPFQSATHRNNAAIPYGIPWNALLLMRSPASNSQDAQSLFQPSDRSGTVALLRETDTAVWVETASPHWPGRDRDAPSECRTTFLASPMTGDMFPQRSNKTTNPPRKAKGKVRKTLEFQRFSHDILMSRIGIPPFFEGAGQEHVPQIKAWRERGHRPPDFAVARRAR